MRYALIYFLLLHFCFAQAQIRFNINLPIGIDTVADLGTKVIELRNNEFLSCGTTSGFMINYNAAYLVKTDLYGNPLWKKQFDFSIGGFDCFYDLVELPDSNYLVAGITTNTLTDDDDGFLAKIDTGGNVIWIQKYMHPDDDEITAMRLTPDGKVILLGYTFSSGTYSDVLLIKTELNGNLIWRKRFGNSFAEKYYSIEIIKNNTEYLLGGDYGYYNSGTPYFDMSLMRTDTAGNIIWQQQYGISPNESGKCAIPTLDSGFAICGMYNDTGVVLKTNKNGVVQWIKKFSSEPSSIIYSLKQLQDSSYVMIKSDIDWQNSNRTGNLIKADKNGNQLWQRIYPHPTSSISNYFFGFNTTSDKGFIMTGQYNHIGQPYQNMWLVKTDSLGCDSLTCSYLVTDIKDISYELREMSLAPNPTNGFLNISSLNDFTKIELLSLTGQTLLSEKVNSKTHQLQLQNFAEGIYFVRVSYADGQSVTKKVILSR